MYQDIIKPNFNKLALCYNIDDAALAALNKLPWIPANLEYQNEESFNYFSTKLEQICSSYDMSDHFNELLYLIMQKNEIIRVRYDAFWQNYNDDMDTKEFTQFLYAYKQASDREHLSISIKPQFDKTITIKNNQIARWICNLVEEKIVSGDFPLDLFGEKMIYNLFGNGGFDQPLDIEKLKEAGAKTPRKPTVRLNKLYVELCMYLQPFLNEHTVLELEEGKLLNDAQANFFFDILEALGYLNRLKINSDPKDYIWALFNNAVKRSISRQ